MTLLEERHARWDLEKLEQLERDRLAALREAKAERKVVIFFATLVAGLVY